MRTTRRAACWKCEGCGWTNVDFARLCQGCGESKSTALLSRSGALAEVDRLNGVIADLRKQQQAWRTDLADV